MAKQQQVVTEEALLKALNELEDVLEKGEDDLEDRDPEGGLSTEGEPLSREAKKSPVVKADKVNKMMSASDMGSDDEEDEDEKKSKKKASKSVAKAGASCKGDDDKGDEEGEEDEDEDMKMSKKAKKSVAKSFTENAQEDESLRKAIEVSDFLESLVEQTSNSLGDLEKCVQATVGEHVDSLSKSFKQEAAHRRDFEKRLAKAVVSMGNQLNEVTNIVKGFAGQPNVPQRRAVLSKSEVAPSPLHEQRQSLSGVTPGAIMSALMQKAVTQPDIADQIEMDIVAYESNGYKLDAISPYMRKALEADLLK